MTTLDRQKQLVELMKRWQKVEDASVVSCARIAQQSDHPLLRLLMAIILRDSQTHLAVQQMVIDSFEQEHPALAPSDLADVWDLIDSHIEIEKQTIGLAQEALGALKNGKMVIPQYLVEYLLEDERKHANLLDHLAGIKRGMYPYGG